MKKLMIYPFNKMVSEMARFRHLLKEYELTAVTSPKSYGYDGKDISTIDGENQAGMEISSCLEDDLLKCDSILFSKSTFDMEAEFYLEKIEYALEQKKEVLVTKELMEAFCNNHAKLPQKVRVLGANPVQPQNFQNQKKYLKEIDVPVILLFSMGEYCKGIKYQLQLIEKFKRDGYKVTSISSDNHGELFGIHMLPDYMFDNSLPAEDMMINFNWYAHELAEKEEADILIIEIKEAVMPYSDRLLNHMGVLPFLVSNAVKADIGVMNLYYRSSDPAYFDNLKNLGKYKYDVEIGYFNITNTQIVIDEFNALYPISYITIDKDEVAASVREQPKELQNHVFHTLDESSGEEAYQQMLAELSDNPPVVSIW